ncbi:hypothetical protein DZB94_14185 [Bacillus sp. AW]|nr:hypothetical protein DZB88_25780 [Bacillus sp. OE]RFB74562.1 hypothetical protein DZB94_14185 [Bacillus sp. AW]
MRDAYVYSYPSSFSIYPALTGSKTHTSKFGESQEVRWGMKNPPLIKVSLYFIISLHIHFLNKKRLSIRIASYTSIFRNIV